MSGRITPLSTAVLLSALAATFSAAQEARAHRLDGQLFLLPNRKIQVESWFSNGDAAKGAKVQVYGAQNELVGEGELNDQGVFVFPLGDIDPRAVIISAGAGHRKVLTLAAKVLERAAAAPENNGHSAGPNGVSTTAVPLAERDSAGPIKDVLVGVGFLLALAAFVLSIRNAQKLRNRP